MPGPRGRRGLALLLVTAAALAAGSATPAADRPTVKRLSVIGLGQGMGRVRSRVVHRELRRLTALQPGAWGGVYTAKSGAHVTIYSSRYYPVDPAVNQAAADFVDSLVHGSEISAVKIYFAPPLEVGILCYSKEVDGCYFPATGDIITVGEDSPWSTVEEVVAHEYGHHVASNRLNDPWPAVTYGTKRWATYEGVCQKEAAGAAFPGDEGEHYFQNPGESFAESFMHLNEVKLGLPETPWGYDPMFTPDAGALAAIEQDVVKPWKVTAVKHWSGRFTRRGQQKTFTFKTPLDGVFAAELRGPRGSTLTVSGPAQIKRYSSGVAAALVCGQRTVTARFTAGGAGRFAAATLIP
ncbi:MAG: hypothetical protein M3R39_04905 [Actinomycetota bacterium]|nr:hypothetical protein [Actinomycetota bacterium]